MDDFDLVLVAKKSVKGVFALISRTFLIQLLSIAANFVLTIYLDPASFGVFFVVSSLIVFLNYFSDIGLAASLIQKKEEPTVQELRTTFTMQQLLVLLLVIPAFFFSSTITEFYTIGKEGLYLFNALLFSFIASSLKTIPTVILERHLNFHKLVIPQIAENFVYNIILIYCAINGYGITSFTFAVFARSIVGLVITYSIQPWPFGLSFDRRVLKNLLQFGLPFQANSFLALIKDDFITLYIGKLLPLQQVGFIGFGQKWAFIPLRLVMDNIIKITFPSFSRLQDDKVALQLLIEKSLFIISFLIFPVVIYAALYSTFLIQFIPKYQKWEPAIFSLIFFSLNAAFASVSVPLTNFLNAIGKVKTTLSFMVFWTALTWIMTPLCVHLFGYNGVSIASCVVAASVLLILFPVKKHLSFSFVQPIYKQILAASLVFILGLFTTYLISNVVTLAAHMIVSGLLYVGVFFLLAKEDALHTIRFVTKNIR